MNPILRSLLTVVGIPTLVSSIHFGFIASDVYVSEASFAIRSAKSAAPTGGLSSLLTSSIVSGGSQDSLLVAEYVHSHDMINQLQKRVDIRAHFSDNEIDFLSRLDEAATDQDMRDYFRNHVRVTRDTTSDILTLSVRSFDADVSESIARNIIDISEDLINDISGRMETDALSAANAEIDIAVQKVNRTSAALTNFRSSNVSMNPIMEAEALFGVVSGLEERITATEAELAEKRAYMRDNSPQVTALKNRVNALRKQRGIEKGRLLGSGSGESSDLIGDYQPLEVARELAQQQYASALASLELARIEAQRKKMYLVTFIDPSRPDEAVEPRRIRSVLTVGIFSFVIYLIGGLMWSALKDHIGK